MIKICKTCLIDKDTSEFYGKKYKNYTIFHCECKPCSRSRSRANSKNRDRAEVNANQRRRHHIRMSNPVYALDFKLSAAERYQETKDEHKALRQRWYSNNKEEYLIGRKVYYQANKASFRARDAKRRALEINAIPDNISTSSIKEIQVIYNNCPDGYEVDHIIPLNNPNVCGLHVPWNLQYLTISDNRKKGNKLC